jgi:hypothetical protein
MGVEERRKAEIQESLAKSVDLESKRTQSIDEAMNTFD